MCRNSCVVYACPPRGHRGPQLIRGQYVSGKCVGIRRYLSTCGLNSMRAHCEATADPQLIRGQYVNGKCVGIRRYLSTRVGGILFEHTANPPLAPANLRSICKWKMRGNSGRSM